MGGRRHRRLPTSARPNVAVGALQGRKRVLGGLTGESVRQVRPRDDACARAPSDGPQLIGLTVCLAECAVPTRT